ncbi:Cof-type HAD-IIB family hydrolase [Desemzia sp. RIT804]|uniref:Cof-type HAD-IIB family hydrolase n=1 Tax=Desemzia sp. RIT 804 TaxID=2810209 RepID=UPI00194E50A0|nr:Cof-type HAD-IIB family hydrolase [Desemzia sp. RIT 804]MBM6615423.1 Cof-type HAD-IIB family hydrolase [Desemzia sp. RIT 804]
MPKIIFFDIDGTLVTHNNSIPDSTKIAIQKLKQNGFIPAISTGRPLTLMQEVAEELGICTFIAMNGQYVVYEGEVIYQNPLPKESIARLVQVARSHKQGIAFCGSEKITGNSMIVLANRGLVKWLRPFISKIAPKSALKLVNRRFSAKPIQPNDYEEHSIYQCIINAPESYDAFYAQEFPEYTFTRSNPYSVDIISKGVSKAIGIQKLLDHLEGTIEETVAFGDGLNDLEMIQFAGIGVAMGNGRIELKNQADLVTDTVWNDGIYKGLDKLGLLNEESIEVS